MKRRKPKSRRKERLIQIRVTAEQKRIMTEAAEGAGLDLSSWLRLLGLRAAGAGEPTAAKGRPYRS